MDDKQAKKWEESKAKGKKRFVVIDGLLMGITISVIWSIMQYFDILIFDLKMEMMEVVAFAVAAPIVFIGFNAMVWGNKEEEYKEYLTGDKKEDIAEEESDKKE